MSAQPHDDPAHPVSALWLAACFVLLAVVFAKLHAPWAPIPWLASMAVCVGYFSSLGSREARGSAASPEFRQISKQCMQSGWGLALVVGVAAFLRLFQIHELPQGPYVDEIQTLRNALALSAAPFDLFGSTPLVRDDWVRTSHVYLYFDWLILKCFGVSYLSMKLFSVIPGVLCCVFFTLMCQTLLVPRMALFAGLFFAVGHWPVRLSRYGWDGAFAVALFAAAIWLWLLARTRRRAVWACLSGIVMGLSLYSYLGARVSAVSLATVVAVDWLCVRDWPARQRALAFAAGLAVAALPLLFAYLEAPELAGIRTAELSIFAHSDWPRILLENLMGHAGMFHLSGGVYARDNAPGVPMLDGVSGLLMLVGLWSLARRHWRDVGWVAALLLVAGWLAGLFSVSQEGPPYVYRSAAVMLPAFLMVGFGAQAIDRANNRASRQPNDRLAWRRYVVPALFAVALVWNWHLYFNLEARSALAARVMAYEIRLIADEVRDTRLPVYLVGADTLMKRRILDRSAPAQPLPYLDRNPTFQFSAGYSLRAVEYLSGRRQKSAAAGDSSVGVEIVDTRGFESAPIATPAVVIFRPGGEGEAKVRARFPDAQVRYVEDIRGPRALGVVAIGEVESAAGKFH